MGERIDLLSISNMENGGQKKISYTRPLLEKAMEHATEEKELCAGIFTPKMNLFRCFMRLLFQNAHTDKEKACIMESVHYTFMFYGITGLFLEYEAIVNGLKSIKSAILEKRCLRETMFITFRVTTDMMSVSLSYILKNIDSILNVWDIGIRNLYFYHYGNRGNDDVTQSIAHTLLEGNDIYGLMGVVLLLINLVIY